MKNKITFDIPYIRLTFWAEILSDTCLPGIKVSALRGGMGEMLLRQNCVTDRKCRSCQFERVCVVSHTLYSQMQKKPAYVTGPESVGYLLECMDNRREFKQGSCFTFTLTLFGDSIAFFNSYLQAFCQLGMIGIGKEKSKFLIAKVCNTQDVPIVMGNQINMRQYRIENLRSYIRDRKDELKKSDGEWRLDFLTPLSMKYQKEYMGQFYGEALVLGAVRRIQMLNYYLGMEVDMPEFAQFPVVKKQAAKLTGIKRYSGTQNTHMILRGIIGKVIFESIPEECLDYLIAGERTQIGRNTSFGFGKYILHRENSF